MITTLLAGLCLVADVRCVGLSSTEVRRRFDIDASLRKEVALISTEPDESEVEYLATALHADWVRKGERWRLFRKPKTLDRLQKADQEWLLARIEETCRRVEQVSRRFNDSEGEAPFKALLDAERRIKSSPIPMLNTAALQASELTPGSRLLVTLLSRFKTEDLDGVRPGALTVFSSDPIERERRLIVDGESLEVYAKAQKRFASWGEEASGRDRIPEAYRWAFPSRSFVPGNRTVLLTIDRRWGQPSFSIQVFEPSGRLESGVQLTAQGFQELGKPTPKAKFSLGRVELSAATLERLRRATPGTRDYRQDTLDPLAYEPLDTYVRDLLLRLAKAKGYEKVVACLPDDLVESAKACVKEGMLDLDAFTEALERADCESITAGKVLIVRPNRPLIEEANRIDRAPISALYRALSKGKFGNSDLLAYHASFGDVYEERPMISRLEKPIVAAFSLQKFPGWALPHSILAVLGKLPASERWQVLSGARLSLDRPIFSDCLFSLATYAARKKEPTIRDLDRVPTRLVACPEGIWLTGESETTTMVRRVSKRAGERVSVDEELGETKREIVKNMFVDSAFVPLPSLAAQIPLENAYESLDQNYLFYWLEEVQTRYRFDFGAWAQVGPVNFRESIRGSKSAVPLGELPAAVFGPFGVPAGVRVTGKGG